MTNRYAAIRAEVAEAKRRVDEAAAEARRVAQAPILERIAERKRIAAEQAAMADAARLAKLDAQARDLEQRAKAQARLLWSGTAMDFEVVWPGLWQEELARRLRAEQANQRPLVRL